MPERPHNDPPTDSLTTLGEAWRSAADGRVRADFRDTASSSTDRLGLRDALDHLRAGDTLVVWRLDRPGRAFKDLNRVRRGALGSGARATMRRRARAIGGHGLCASIS